MDSYFATTQSLKVEYSHQTITEYVSKRTGMRVVLVDQVGPKVLGFFTVATEIFDDSGSPHTLEHLCFMGSKNYPYKGLLDKLATRGYSNTNAWTATDHTAYTLETAGYAAFARILPVYLEHVILPTLTDAGCYTEVFHIDGTGHDAGVVYSEMQGVQNTQSELTELRSKRIMYPEGIGFRYETGGMMEALRVLKAERIRQFHRDMYQPKNLCLILVGEIDHVDLLTTLKTFEDTIISDIPGPDQPFRRPWLESPQPPPLSNSVIETVEFPEEDESVGEISVKYFGPSCNDQLSTTALSTILGYLASSSASVLENVLVEKEQLASAVYYYATARPNSVIEFTISGVNTSQLSQVEERFRELIRQTANSKLDMEYLNDCLIREKRQQLFMAENLETFYTTLIIATFLFSPDRNLTYLSHLEQFNELAKWPEQKWRDFIQTWLVDGHSVTILSKPSAALSKKLKEDEETRIEDRRKELGEEGLKSLIEKLELAQAENDKPIPQELIEGFEIPSTDTIHFISTTPARAGSAKDLGTFDNPIQDIVDQDVSKDPLFIHFENISSNFINVHLLVGTTRIPTGLRPLLPVYMENFFNSPILRSGNIVEFEEVVKGLERDTVDYSISSASNLGNSEMLDIEIRVELDKYQTAIEWLRDLMWNGVFDPQRIMSTTMKLLMDVPEEKRNGGSMAASVSTMVNDAPESISRARDTLVKALYLKRIRRILETEPGIVIKHLEEIQEAICQVSNFRVLVVADVQKVEDPVKSWDILTEGRRSDKPLLPLDKRADRLSEAGKNPGNRSYIIPLATIDSSFALSVTKGPEDSLDPQVPALMVAIAYLDAVEGPLWTAVRGTGLAYGCSISRRIAQIEFSVYRSPDAFKAFAAAKNVIEDYISGAREFDPLALEGAISSIVLMIARSQATMYDSARDQFVKSVIRELPREWNDILLDKVRNVTVEEIKQTMEQLLMPAFQPKTANVFVTCAPVMEQSLVERFKGMGFEPEVRQLSSFQDDYGLSPVAGDKEDSGSSEELDGSQDVGSEDEL